VTCYGLGGLGNESQWGVRFSAPIQTGTGAHPAFYMMGSGFYSQGESGWGVALNTHPPPSIKVKERVQHYIYSPSGPSWPVLG